MPYILAGLYVILDHNALYMLALPLLYGIGIYTTYKWGIDHKDNKEQ